MAKVVGNISKTVDEIQDSMKDKDLSNFGTDFQVKLVHLLIKDRVFSFSMLPIIKSEYITDPYLKAIFVMVSLYVDHYQQLPIPDNIRIMLSENGMIGKGYDTLLDKVVKADPTDRDFVIENARKFCFTRFAIAKQDEIRKLLNAGKFEEAKVLSIDSFKFTGSNTTKILSLKKDYEQVFHEEAQHNPVPTPFPTFNDNMKGGPGTGNLVIMVAESNFGKSYMIGTQVFMSDMTLKNIEDITVGEKVMGWDGKPRTVKALDHGFTDMYRIDQNNGDSYTVNKDHDLCIINSWDEVKAENVQIMNPVQYLERMNSRENRKWRLHNRGFKSPGIDFEERELPVDPYWLGLWLGDGSKSDTQICGVDMEVGDWLTEYYKSNDAEIIHKISTHKSFPNNKPINRWTIKRGSFISKFQYDYNLIDNKHIPEIFLKNSRENRLKLLAGLIDTDGGLGPLKTSVEITQKLDSIADGIVFLCRSLGLKVSLKKKEGKIDGIVKGIYNRIIVSGKGLVDVPTKIARKKFVALKTKKDELKTRITVTPVGIGEYFGFEIEEDDKMFLLADFTVVHNSNALIAFARHANMKGKTTVFFSFEIGGADMLRRHLAGLSRVKQEEVKNSRNIIELRLSSEDLGDFILIEERATNAKISVIKNTLDYLKSSGVYANLVLVDALNQLKLPSGMKYEGDNQKFEYLAEELRDLANEEMLPVITVMQGNRSSFNSQILDVAAIGKAIEPFQVADVLMTFSQTREMAADNHCICLLLKNRLGKKGIALECFYDPNMCVFEELSVVNDMLLLSEKSKEIVKQTATSYRDKVRSGAFDKKN